MRACTTAEVLRRRRVSVALAFSAGSLSPGFWKLRAWFGGGGVRGMPVDLSESKAACHRLDVILAVPLMVIICEETICHG